MSNPTTQPGTEVTRAVSQELMNQFWSMASAIPEADDSNAYEDIVAQILNADGVDGLNAPWETEKAERLNGHRLKIESITKRDSDKDAGLGIYLVVKGTDLGTGEKFTWSTSAVSIVAQLAKAHFLAEFPVIATLVVSDKLTKAGYRPQHLDVHSIGTAK